MINLKGRIRYAARMLYEAPLYFIFVNRSTNYIDRAGNYTGVTLLMQAVMDDDIHTVRVLCKRGANVNRGVDHKCFDRKKNISSTYQKLICPTPLCAAANNGNLEMVKLLLDNGAKNLEQALYWAVRCNHFEIVDLLVERKPQLATIKHLSFFKESIFTRDGLDAPEPLLWAAHNNELRTVELLLAKGASANCRSKGYEYFGNNDDRRNLSPLMLSNDELRIRLRELRCRLVAYSATLIKYTLLKGERYTTPIIWAVYHLNLDLVKLLVKNDTNVNVTIEIFEFNPVSLLWWAVYNNKTELSLLLIELGAEVACSGINNLSVLELAITNKNAVLVKKILQGCAAFGVFHMQDLPEEERKFVMEIMKEEFLPRKLFPDFLPYSFIPTPNDIQRTIALYSDILVKYKVLINGDVNAYAISVINNVFNHEGFNKLSANQASAGMPQDVVLNEFKIRLLYLAKILFCNILSAIKTKIDPVSDIEKKEIFQNNFMPAFNSAITRKGCGYYDRSKRVEIYASAVDYVSETKIRDAKELTSSTLNLLL